MRKIYPLIAALLLAFTSQVSFAQTMTEENAVLDELGYRLEKDVNFYEGTVNGKEIVPSDAFKFSEEKEEFKVNSYNPTKLANIGLEFMSIQIPGNNTSFAAGTGFRSTGNERWVIFNNLRVGQIVAFDISDVADTTRFVVNSIACNGNTGWADTPSDPLIVEPISGSIHELQELAEEGSADQFRYFKVINEGPLCCKFNGKNSANTMYRMQIWSSKDEAEVVSAPILEMVQANGSKRLIKARSGESTLGNECKVWWGIADQGDKCLNLVETEEIDHVETVYDIDEETGDTIGTHEVTIYKKIIENVEEAGDYEYDENGIEVSANNDDDQDGFVTILAATVSSSGMYSEIVSLTVSVEVLKLNDPTVQLVGFNGLERIYKLNWVDNRKGNDEEKPAFFIYVEGDNAGENVTFGENEGIGEVFAIKNHAVVTISAEGYDNGVCDVVADAPDVDIHRKNVSQDEEGNAIHDWDFVNITKLQQDIIKGEVMEACYLITDSGDSLVFTPEEYENGISNDQLIDLGNAVPLYKQSCWWWDGGKSRATLNVNSDTIVDNSLLHDKNANGYGYVDDEAEIFKGININCPPNANNNSCIFMYINGDLGAYFMAQPTITFSPELVKAGELVAIHKGQGGSTWTDWRETSIYPVPEGELLSITLEKNGVHVFYIDVYTYDGVEDSSDLNEQWNETVGVSCNKAIQPIVGYYSASGAKIAAPQKGINIVKFADGASMKILVK